MNRQPRLCQPGETLFPRSCLDFTDVMAETVCWGKVAASSRGACKADKMLYRLPAGPFHFHHQRHIVHIRVFQETAFGAVPAGVEDHHLPCPGHIFLKPVSGSVDHDGRKTHPVRPGDLLPVPPVIQNHGHRHPGLVCQCFNHGDKDLRPGVFCHLGLSRTQRNRRPPYLWTL